MRIYYIEECRGLREEMEGLPLQMDGLKKAAGAEGLFVQSASAETMKCSRGEDKTGVRNDGLKELALRHINDELHGLEDDEEFIRAERQRLLAELAARVAPAEWGLKR